MPIRSAVYQFKITLKGIRPPIWRRIQVPETYSFWDLHVAIQDAMGWLDYHLHMFRFGDVRSKRAVQIGLPDDDPFLRDVPLLTGWEVPMLSYFKEPGDKAAYDYDFGDGWEHEILLEGIVVRRTGEKYPKCLAGARACPPEDCGGIHGYANLLKVVADPTHEEHENMMEWLGGSFSPSAFDPGEITFDDPKERLAIMLKG